MNKIVRDSSSVSINKIFSLYAGMNQDFETKGEIIGVSQDYNAVEKWAITIHVRAAVHANFKDICGVQDTRKENELSRSRKSILLMKNEY